MQSDIIATSGAYTYGFARFSADLPRALFAAVLVILAHLRYGDRGRLHIGGIRVLVYAPRGVLVTRSQLAQSRSRAHPTRGRRDVRQDREWGMVRHLFASSISGMQCYYLLTAGRMARTQDTRSSCLHLLKSSRSPFFFLTQ